MISLLINETQKNYVCVCFFNLKEEIIKRLKKTQHNNSKEF